MTLHTRLSKVLLLVATAVATPLLASGMASAADGGSVGPAVAAPLAGSARRAGRFRLTLSFLATAGALAMGTYTAIAAQTGWSTLVNDSWLLGYNLPPEIAHYNRRLAGLNRPFYSAWRVLLACLKLGVLAAMIASLSALAAGTARRSNAATVSACHVAPLTRRLARSSMIVAPASSRRSATTSTASPTSTASASSCSRCSPATSPSTARTRSPWP